MGLEIARAPRHRCFDELVTDHENPVARAGSAEAVGAPVRRAIPHREVDDVRPADRDAFRLEQADEAVEFSLRPSGEEPRIAPSGEPPRETSALPREVAP